MIADVTSPIPQLRERRSHRFFGDLSKRLAATRAAVGPVAKAYHQDEAEIEKDRGRPSSTQRARHCFKGQWNTLRYL